MKKEFSEEMKQTTDGIAAKRRFIFLQVPGFSGLVYTLNLLFGFSKVTVENLKSFKTEKALNDLKFSL